MSLTVRSETTARADRLHRDAIIVDATCPVEYWAENVDEWLRGGATSCFVTLASSESCRDAIKNIAAFYKFARANEDRLTIATSTQEIRKAKADGKLAAVMHFQGTHPIEYDSNLVEVFWRLGVRVMQLAYNQRSAVCDGCEEPADAGLSQLGHRVVGELNRLNIAIDLSHTGRRASFEAIEASSSPCIISHANAEAVHKNQRNLPDELIRAVVEAGGVIGLNGFPSFITTKTSPTLDDLIDHMVHIDSIVGSGHVGLGLDYCHSGTRAEYEELIDDGLWSPENYTPPPWNFPIGIEDPSTLSRLTERLVERGYTDDEIRGVLGENWMRVLNEIWTE